VRSPRETIRAKEVRRQVVEFGLALLNVAAALFSIVMGLTLALALVALLRTPAPPESSMLPAHAWHWVAALSLAFGLPALLAFWKHPREFSKLSSTMTWLPGLCAGVWFVLAVVFTPSWASRGLLHTDGLVAAALGDSHPATRLVAASAHEAAAQIDPKSIQEPPFATVQEVGRDPSRAHVIDLVGDGAGIFVDVVLTGPKGESKHRYLFDTGASYTTITSEMARELGIEVPSDAPSIEFSTAAGARSSKMVYLPKLQIGKESLNGLLVSICDSCATERYPGLLGINALREFYIEMDYQSARMELVPRIYDGPANRAYDILPMTTLSIEGRPELWMRHVRWVTLVTNRAKVPIRNVIPKVEFNNGTVLYGDPIAEIAPGASAKSLVRGRAATKSSAHVEFTLRLAQAQW
jgi:clan AA aspartic protease (TIGR02281 family)